VISISQLKGTLAFGILFIIQSFDRSVQMVRKTLLLKHFQTGDCNNLIHRDICDFNIGANLWLLSGHNLSKRLF